MESYNANAITNTTARADIPRLAANNITCDAASGWRTQQASLVLWPGRAIYLGMGQSSTLHRHYAMQICISLGAPFQVRTRARGPYTEQQSFIVGPHIPHQIEMTEVPSFVLWIEARALADLARRLRPPRSSISPSRSPPSTPGS